jgi:hypothetical protein
MELLNTPIDVGSLGFQTEGGLEREPWAMTVTIDPDSVPHLREAFERNSSGHLLGTITQWHTLTHDDPGVSPLAFLRVQLPEFVLVFNVGFGVDEYKRSLAVAARTGRVFLVEPALNKAMRLESPWTAMRERLSIGLCASGVEARRLTWWRSSRVISPDRLRGCLRNSSGRLIFPSTKQHRQCARFYVTDVDGGSSHTQSMG